MGGDLSVPASRHLAGHQAVELGGRLSRGSAKSCFPGFAVRSAPGACAAPLVHNAVWNLIGFRGPTKRIAGTCDFFVAKRRAVAASCAGFCRSAKSNGRPAGDHRRGACCFCRFDRLCDRARIVAIHRLHVPARCFEASGLVIRDGQRRRPVDGDTVVVEQNDQFGEF